MVTREDLTEGWTLRLADDGRRGSVPAHVLAALPIAAQVPGTVHTDLLRAGLIADPYLDRNELTQDWIGHADWVYERTFEIATDEDAAGAAGRTTHTSLEFDGLDTVATVTVNGTVVATTQNMHRRYVVELDEAARPGTNRLAVRFDSPWRYAQDYQRRSGTQPNQYPTPFNFIRKSACNFGWDWGPTLVTAGIWRAVRLVRSVGPRLSRVRPIVGVEAERGTVEVRIDVDRPGAGDLTLTAEIAGVRESVTLTAGAQSTTIRLEVPNPRLWWPAGLGDQHRYPAVVTLASEEPLDTWQADLGFRSLELRTDDDEAGSEFTFVINGATVPVRGANWIPDDCFLPRVDEPRLRERIGQAVDAHMNMLRVWGGGVYESEEFYRVCDELGVLVWQDFLFACAGYPEDEPLRSEVEAEAVDNVARLMPHPSLVLWNGNNENIWGWFDWNWEPLMGERDWGLGYYLDVLPAAVAEVDPSRPYRAGSPYSGSMDIHPNDENRGCMHVWDVWNQVDYNEYRRYRPRFVSEFGWQAPPTWSTMRTSIRDEPLTPTSVGMLHHQKAEDGNGKLERGLAPHFDVPSDILDWHFAMQLNQARAMRLGVEHYRSLRPHNQGVIIWQLNDCWPVTSWSAVDGYGRKKLLWYGLRAAYRPRLLTIQPDGEGWAAIGVNDGGETWRETVTISRVRFDGTTVATYATRLAADRFGAARVRIPDDVAIAADPHAELLLATTATGARAVHFFAEDKDLAYPPPRLHATATRSGDEVVVTVTAESLLRDLCLFPDRLAPAAEVDRACLTLLPGEVVTLRVTQLPPGLEEQLLSHPVLRTANELVTAGESSGAVPV